MLRVMSFFIKFVAFFFNLLPKKRRVVFLSRQSSVVSLDFSLLIKDLRSRLDATFDIRLCLINPETENYFSFAWGTLKQLYFFCTSSVVVADGYIPAISIPKKNSSTTVIQLWHALGAIKKFGYQCLDTPAGRTVKSAKIARMHKNYDYIIAGGPGAIPAFAEAFNYPEAQILPLGLPRIDYLLNQNDDPSQKKKRLEILQKYPFLNNGKFNILYAPTLRKGPGYDNWLAQYVKQIAEKHSEDNVNLIVASHPLNKSLDGSFMHEYPIVKPVTDVATIDLLQFADCVVSDYSAIMFEAGLLEKKLECHTPDIETYRISPGLNIEPETIDSVFIQQYFSGVERGSTNRITQLILRHL